MSSPRPSDTSRNQKSSSFPVRFAKSAFFQIFVFFTTVIVLGVAYASWTTLNVSQGADGQPVTQTLMQGIINNLNDLDARVDAISGSAPIVVHCLSEVQGNSTTQTYTDCPITLPSGNWRIIVHAFGHQGVLNGTTELFIDGVSVNSGRRAIGDTSGTDYVPIYGTKDVTGGRAVPIKGEWNYSNGDREIMAMAFRL